MKKGLHRAAGLFLAAVTAFCLTACNTVKNESSDVAAPALSREEAFRQVLQGTVNRYGIIDEEKREKLWDTESTDTNGLITAKCIDVTGDGQDELFCVYKSPDGINFEVYEYENGAAKRAWNAIEEWSGISSLNVCRTANNQVYWLYEKTRYFSSDAVTYKDGKYIQSSDFGEFTDEEWNYIGTGGGGLVAEGQRQDEVMLKRIGININDEHESLLSYAGGGLPSFENELISEWNLTIPEPKRSAQEVLADIPYYGDRSKCVMTKKMAAAYAAAIESLPEEVNLYDTKHELKAMLADVAGDGMPLLLTAYVNPSSHNLPYWFSYDIGDQAAPYIWTWNGNTAEKYDFSVDAETDRISIYSFYPENDNVMIRIGDGYLHEAGDAGGAMYYTVENAQLKKVGSHMLYCAVTDSKDSSRAIGELLSGVSTFEENGRTYARVQDLLDAGWVKNPNDDVLCARRVDGVMQSYADDNSLQAWDEKKDYPKLKGETKEDEIIYIDPDLSLTVNSAFWGDGSRAAEKLREYIDAADRPSYSYAEASYMFTDEQIRALAEETAKSLNGEVGEIYKLSDDLYYVIIYVNDEPCGGVIVKNVANGTGWRVISSSGELMTESALQDAVNSDQSVSNISIDYGKTDKGAEYLSGVLNNIDGTVPNDRAKSELAAYVENCVSENSKATVKASRNCVTITDADVKASLANAAAARGELDAVLNEKGVTLNKGITVILRIVCNKTNMKEPIQITLDGSVAGALGEADAVQIIPDGTPYSVRVTADALKQAIERYGCLVVIIQKTGDNTYSIQFADAQGNMIDKLDSGLNFTLPASDALCTVQAEYTGGTDNWGGQFDENNKTISFDTPYSGTYTVLEDNEDITDIGDLTDEQQKAVRFMVSKGYFDAENGLFNPNETLTRYDFSQALVRMFFALDKSLKCDFPDVSEDNPYYPYVASGVAINVIEGYDDGEFKGDRNVLREEVLGLCSRTLREKKGYLEPEAPSDYLHFTDADSIPDWARSEIALDVREGLITEGGKLEPSAEITRAESAEILYKLFMLLNEVEPVNVKSAGTSNVITLSVAGGAVVLAAALAVVIFLISKKKGNKKSQEQNTEE